MRPLLLLAAIALAGCQGENAAPDAEPSTEAEAPEPAPAPRPVMFEALSKTAESFTGSIFLSQIVRDDPNALPAMKLEAATGLVYETELKPGAAAEATAIDWKTIFSSDDISATPAPGAPSIDLHIVTLETVPPGAPNGGYCGEEKTYAIAMATGLEVIGQPYLGIAAFKGVQWPPNDETALCGVFNYAPPG